MPTFQKIPKKVKEKGCIALGRYCVFAGFLEAGKVVLAIQKAEKRGAIPAVGYITIKGKKYYYCLYGLLNDPDIYSSK